MSAALSTDEVARLLESTCALIEAEMADRNHTRQVLVVQQERAYPRMANAQKFVGE